MLHRGFHSARHTTQTYKALLFRTHLLPVKPGQDCPLALVGTRQLHFQFPLPALGWSEGALTGKVDLHHTHQLCLDLSGPIAEPSLASSCLRLFPC